jgi:hypothetical protein
MILPCWPVSVAPERDRTGMMTRTLALLLCLAAHLAAADTPARNDEVARWFAHCAAFDSADEGVHSLAGFACIDRAVQMCRTVEQRAPGSGCFDRLEASARAETTALIPVLQAIAPTTAFDRGAITRELAQLAGPPVPRDCPAGLAPVECAAFLALVDWAGTRAVIFGQSR